MASNVNVTYEEMRKAANDLSDGHADIIDKLQVLQAFIKTLVNGGYVTDRSSKQFEHSYEEFNTGANKTIEGLQGMSAYLKKAAETFEQADHGLAQGLNG
ncbi:WXG100 family type VII secretion target [Yinghuangia seranimata]|uniref:WXG100 family type VII secretion target n=1 Tax=Yinghuangia seranimata TaxID=408067 RepID=UPI00248A91A5|nr:WXG100 family type VII secretion target [Yinghuangia seranimata]MDI2125810.1 WXG100 family type VII secretion target [Yinghuangia seranimata]